MNDTPQQTPFLDKPAPRVRARAKQATAATGRIGRKSRVAAVAPVAPVQAQIDLEDLIRERADKDPISPLKLPATEKTDPVLLALAHVWACNGALANACELREQRFEEYRKQAPEDHIVVGEEKLFSGGLLDFRKMLEKRKVCSLNGMKKYIDQLHSARNRLELHKGLRAAARRKSDLAAAETAVRKIEDELAGKSALALATTPTTNRGCFELITYVATVLEGDGLNLETLALRSAARALSRGA